MYFYPAKKIHLIQEKEIKVRVDKWLWAVRIIKSRSQASSLCNSGKVIINKTPVKPSRMIEIGDEIVVRKDSLCRTFLVLQLANKRMSAKLVANFYEDITPKEEIEKHNETIQSVFYRPKGQGRPTKKERRTIDNWKTKDD